MTTTTEYTQQLALALRMRDVPGAAIGDAVAQVESHVADTGEDPVEAFGPARAYAASVAATVDRPAPALRVVRLALLALAGALLGVALALGIAGLVRGEPVVGGIPPIVAVLVGGLGIVGVLVVVSVVSARRMRGPRIHAGEGRSRG
ncbi:hypothetical protein PED38_12475 [Clavibacter sp. CT19]|uniref:hypothetical protein n=1 Tax=Clavibacter sp. CT19 TaxID=3018990 RepID=UPI0022EA9D2B|nr:hypothetical protein [Clavibacter sp. CT19]MDA3805614.1 hypothetical protein [Clavibacter sp. CT19]